MLNYRLVVGLVSFLLPRLLCASTQQAMNPAMTATRGTPVDTPTMSFHDSGPVYTHRNRMEQHENKSDNDYCSDDGLKWSGF